MARRKRIYTNVYKTLEEAVDFIKRVKEINGNRVEIEMTNSVMWNSWVVEVWQIK